MSTNAPQFIPGAVSTPALPLARYLPPLPPGMVAGWLAENLPPESWVLDPLGASPALALEAARAGYRVLMASNNPILSFMTETLARAPGRADFQAALAELAVARRGEERLEKHILSLYQTECDVCGEHVPAQAFLWRKGESKPFARIFHCPRCDTGVVQRDITQADLDRLASMGGDKLQRARALQRVLLNEEEHRAGVEEALENYPSRPLYVLFTLLNKIEGLGLPAGRANLLRALLISAFDSGNALWPWPGGRARPRQLTTPPQFRENNLWMALENAVEEWVYPTKPVEVTHWPELPQGKNGISLFHGRVKTLVPLAEEVGPAAVLTVFPRPSQAFWTLSVLWSGWLWGAEAALPLRNVLDRRRYDWNWHTAAIHSALAAVGGNIPAQTPFFGILTEVAPGFLSAAVVAAEASGFCLQGLALRAENQSRAEQEIAQGTWLPSGFTGGAKTTTSPQEMERIAREAVRAYLQERGEPAAYLSVYAAGLSGLAEAGAIPRSQGSIPADLLARIQAVLARIFADRSLLRRYTARTEKPERGEPTPAARSESTPRGEPTAEEERSVWWLSAPKAFQENELPLGDRIEMEVVRFLQKHATANTPLTFEALDEALCAQFPGLFSPPLELVRACLESYAQNLPAQLGMWQMPASETAAARRADLQEMRAAVEAAGRRLGYSTREQGNALIWEQAGQGEWWFFRMASSILSRYVLADAPGPLTRCVLVLPGSRAKLLAYRLRRDPRLAEAVQGWRFLKFRHLRDIAGRADLRQADWQPLLDEDPLTDEATQMALFPS